MTRGKTGKPGGSGGSRSRATRTSSPPRVPPRPDARRDDKPTYYDNVHVSFSCFAAGTPVHTLERPAADRIVQDRRPGLEPRTLAPGHLATSPSWPRSHNKPARLLKISLGQEAIRATGIHRFWKVGHGWVMARDLKPGDALRALGGVAVGQGRGARSRRAGLQPQGDAGSELLRRSAGYAGSRQQSGRACAPTVRRHLRAARDEPRVVHAHYHVSTVQQDARRKGGRRVFRLDRRHPGGCEDALSPCRSLWSQLIRAVFHLRTRRSCIHERGLQNGGRLDHGCS